MQFGYVTPVTEENSSFLCADLQRAIGLRKIEKVRFFTVTILRFILILIGSTQVFMSLFSELKFILPNVYDILDSLLVKSFESLGIPYIFGMIIYAVFTVLFPFLVGYLITSLMESTLVKKGYYDITDFSLSEKKTEISSLLEEYDRTDSGELVYAIGFSLAIALLSLVWAIISSESFIICLVSFVASAILTFVLIGIDNTDVLSESDMKKLRADVEEFTKENDVEVIKIEKKELVTDDDREKIEHMTGDEIHDYALTFLGKNTKKCFALMEIAEENGSMNAHQFIFASMHDCLYFSNGICKLKSVDGEVVNCYHNDGTWSLCEDRK